jgi:membrane protease YdiL (CAAX protease family)
MISASTPSLVRKIIRDHYTWLLISGLIILRFPLLIGARLLRPDTEGWAISICEVGTYLLAAVLIVWERDRLANSHIDSLAIGLLLLKPFEILFYRNGSFGPYTGRACLLYIPIAVCLAVVLLVRRPSFHRLSWRNLVWLAAGALAGMGMGIGVGYLFSHFQTPGAGWVGRMSLSDIFETPDMLGQYLLYLVRKPLQQAFYAGAMEEPLFRGFLWGALLRAGWKHGWICLFQAGLFCLGHIYYLLAGLYWSFGFTFIAGLVFGALAWRTRSIVTSITAHGFANGWGDIFAHMIRW